MRKTAVSTPMKLNDEGVHIKEAQELLRKAGSSIKVNGIFTIGMYSAVKAFQKKHGLKVTGKIDSFTWDKLLDYKKPARKTIKMGGKK